MVKQIKEWLAMILIMTLVVVFIYIFLFHIIKPLPIYDTMSYEEFMKTYTIEMYR